MSAFRSASESRPLPARRRGGAGPRLGAAAGWLVAALGAPSAGWADSPSVRLGALQLSPAMLLQLDGGGTFDQTRDHGQGEGVNLRRARLGGIARLDDALTAGVIWDFGGTPGGHSSLYQADLKYSGPLPLAARAGVFKAPFTLEGAQQAGDTLFLERATIDALVVGLVAGGGRVGGQLGGTGDCWFASAFLTGGRTGAGARSDQRAVLGRVAGLAVRTGSWTLHLGASAGWLYQVARSQDGTRTLQLSDQPEIQLDMVSPSLSSGAVPASGARVGGLEAGLGWDRLWVQAEGYAITLDAGHGAGRSPTTSGGYAQAAYVLAAKPRQWSAAAAAWGSPKPEGGWGGLEAGARFSLADVNGLAGEGGRQSVWSADLSWYPHDAVRVVLEYSHARVQGGAAPRSLDVLAARAQIGF